MKIYRVQWYLNSPEDRVITKYITNRDVAQDHYDEMRKLLSRGACHVGWVSLVELVENDEFEIVEGEHIHYCEA